MEENSINKRIGEQLRLHRQKKNLSLEALSFDMELSISTLSNYERGTKSIKVDRLYKLLAILKTDVMDFFAAVEDVPNNHTVADDPVNYGFQGTMNLQDEIRKIKIELERLRKESRE